MAYSWKDEDVEDSTPVECGSCRWQGTAEEVMPARNFGRRIEAGGVVPVGECLHCGSLAYLLGRPTERLVERMKAALQQLLDDLSDAGEDRNPTTGEVYDSVHEARRALLAAGGHVAPQDMPPDAPAPLLVPVEPVIVYVYGGIVDHAASHTRENIDYHVLDWDNINQRELPAWAMEHPEWLVEEAWKDFVPAMRDCGVSPDEVNRVVQLRDERVMIASKEA